MTRAPAWLAISGLAASTFVYACADIWGFDDLRVGSDDGGGTRDGSGSVSGGGRDSTAVESGSESDIDSGTPGSDAGIGDTADVGGEESAAPEGGVEAGLCIPNTTQCLDNSVQTCDSMGQWGTIVGCSNATVCAGGKCVPGSCNAPTCPACTLGSPCCNSTGACGCAVAGLCN